MLRVTVRLLILAVVSANQACADDSDRSSTTSLAGTIDLSHVVDQTDLAFEESGAYYNVLDHVQNVPAGELQRAAAALLHQRWQDSPKFQQWPEADFPLFYDMTQHPKEYRGQPVAMRGHLVRLVKYAAGPNDHGIETLYEGWLVTPDAETHPTTVVCTEIPAGMPIGEELIDGVSVAGYFFKLHTYSSRDRKTRFAPMILARTLNWSPPDQTATGWPVSQPLVISALLCLTLASGIIAWMSARRTRAARDLRVQADVPDEPPEFLNELTP